jgi:hypothetical protein
MKQNILFLILTLWLVTITPLSAQTTLLNTSLSINNAVNSVSSFTINSNTDWSISAIPEWLSLDKTSGTGNATIIVTAIVPNTTMEIRSSELIISGSGIANITLTVTQGELNGMGTLSQPYLISNYAQLKLAKNDLSAYYRLTNDIDATISKTENAPFGFEPIGTYDIPFTGHFNGAGYSIKDMYINKTGFNDIGFFGTISGATVENLGLNNCTIIGDTIVGGLTGDNISSSSISNCYFIGTVSGKDYIGGLVGNNYNATISKCYTTGTVSGSDYIGGLVGYNEYATITNCYATGSASGDNFVGGLMGCNDFASIIGCYATGDVSSGNYSGGLVGYNFKSAITSCYTTGGASGDKYTGGLVGYNDGSSITKCYAAGNVTGNTNTGGLVGINSGTTTITSSYYNLETSGQSDTDKGSPLSTNSLKNQNSFTEWDFNTVWKISTGTYPGLQAINNGPFAFRDTIDVRENASLDLLLKNDYDVESSNTALVFKVLKLYGIGTIDPLYRFNFPTETPEGTIDSLVYRIGELVAVGDTLWGNKAIAVLKKVLANNAPVITSIAPTTAIKGQVYAYNVTATDNEGSTLTYTLHNAPNGMIINGNVITWTPDGSTSTSGEVTLTVSDGDLSATEKFTITVSIADAINNLINNNITVYPNPASNGFYIQVGKKTTVVSIYNTNGTLVLSQQATNTEYIRISNLSKGIYTIRTNIDGKIESYRIVKQ